MVALGASQFHDLIRIQIEIATQVILDGPLEDFVFIGAVAQSFSNNVVFSLAFVVDSLMNVVDESTARAYVKIPYVAGLLFFREGPAAIAALKKLRMRPDVVIVHGCGINHPRFVGLASHIGVALNISTIGVSKTTLCGEYVEPDQTCRCVPLKFKGRQLGFVLKTVMGAKPIFISPGHRVSLPDALEVVQRSMLSQRLPEPLRLAQINARQARFKFVEVNQHNA
jgi:deoxyribonuclease V